MFDPESPQPQEHPADVPAPEAPAKATEFESPWLDAYRGETPPPDSITR
jgi:hypothetical protein